MWWCRTPEASADPIACPGLKGRAGQADPLARGIACAQLGRLSPVLGSVEAPWSIRSSAGVAIAPFAS